MTFNQLTSKIGRQRIISALTGVFVQGDELDLASISTSSSTVTLDFNSKRQRIFSLQPSISATKTIALAASSYALSFTLKFTITQSFINANQYLQFPSDFTSNAGPLWDVATKRFTPIDVGLYNAEATYDGTNWQIVFEPFTFN